jgi:hypothetical protein
MKKDGAGKRSPELEKAERLGKVARKWAESPSGMRAIRKAVTETDALLKKLEEARRVTPELLRQPFTV